MTNTIGEKIKVLRKELDLTQTELAGAEMTKSMLSQIENHQAYPSMKNLQYLANRLNKPISYFLDENPQKIANPLPVDYINSVIKQSYSLFAMLDLLSAKKVLDDLLKKYKFDKNDKLYGQILFMKGKCLVHLNNFSEGEKNLQEAFDLFVKSHLYTEAAKAYACFTERYFAAFNYEKCLEILGKAEDIYKCSAIKDIIFEIDLIYDKIAVTSSMGNINEGLKLINKGLTIGKETGIYYKTESYYRIAARFCLYEDNFEKFLYYIEKASLFAKFSEDKEAIGKIAIHMACYENNMNNPMAALEQLKIHEENIHTLTYIYYLEKAKSYYLLNEYKIAQDYLKKIDYSFYANYRLDYLELWCSKIYEGLILHNLSKSSEGITSIKTGIEKLEVFKSTKYLAFAYKILSEICSEIGSFEEAFKALKKCDEIKSDLALF